MAKKSEFSIVRSFVKHFLRGGLKGTGAAAEAVINPLKLVDAVTGVLDEVIFGILEDKAAKEESQKLHEKLDRLLEEQAKGADARETDFAEVIAGLHLQADFNEKVEAELGKILSLLKEPDEADVPEEFAAAVDRVLARDEELLEALLDKLGALSEEHAALSSEHGEIIAKADEITAAIEALGERMEGIRPHGDSRRERKAAETRVFLSKLPVTGRELFGRDKQLMTLSRAWVSHKTKIISFVAWGGVGKTALVNEWVNRMGEKHWAGAERVYGWSFYSQGTREDRQASSDPFLAHSLEWFGDKETAESANSAWNKGVRLAELVRGQKTLLILDGVEPLQYPPGPMQGRLKDQGLQGLLRELSHGMNGLCVITTREEIKDLEGQVGHTVKRVELENLSPEAGMQVLREAGVTKGTDKELMQASEEFGGHALALTLLGNYLAVVQGGEIRKRDLVPALMEEEEQGGHAKRVMKSYEIWLKLENKAEVDILYLMGLFDRPAEAGAIKKLREEPAIKGLTDNIVSLSEAKWRYAVKHLRELGLLGKEDEGRSGDLDCHPLVREHFGEKLKKERAKAWREAHSRLYEYYKGVPEKEQPDTLEEMEPLFRAVYHGSASGMYQEALDDVYWKRIQRGNEKYSMHKLGAFGSDLGAVSCLFDEVWRVPATGLTNPDKAFVLIQAGFALRAVGRLRETAEPMETGLELQAGREDWKNAAIAASNLSELYLTLGEVEKAVDYARRSVEYADKSGDEFLRMGMRSTLADVLHQAGKIGEARRLFEEAERIQEKRQPAYKYLYSAQGYRYCDLLLSQGKMGEVKERASQTLEWMTNDPHAPVLTVVVDKLSLGRTWLAEAVSKIKDQKAKSRIAEEDLIKAGRWLNEAVDGLRNAGQQDHLPRGLLARAGYYRAAGNYEKARVDLEEAREIAERGDMKLFLADYHLESARLARSENDKEKMAEHYGQAKALIEQCGYHRRDGELEELACVSHKPPRR